MIRVPPATPPELLTGLAIGEDGRVLEFDQSAFGPPGYLPWRVLEVGNGDTFGFYWAVGRESSAPIVCGTEHDDWSVVPISGDVDSALRLIAARFFGDFEGDMPEPEGVEPWEAEGAGGIDLLRYDERSPYALFEASKEVSSEEAIVYLRTALEVLPEYTNALFRLAELLRATGAHEEALRHYLEAATAPAFFGNGVHRRAVERLQRAPDDALPDCRDPIWLRRNELTLADGEKENPDYALYEDAIGAYHDLGWGVRAVRLRMLVGELMRWETVSFRERSGWSDVEQARRLRADVERAGLYERLVAVPEPTGG